jgi:hypothetical protein
MLLSSCFKDDLIVCLYAQATCSINQLFLYIQCEIFVIQKHYSNFSKASFTLRIASTNCSSEVA